MIKPTLYFLLATFCLSIIGCGNSGEEESSSGPIDWALYDRTDELTGQVTPLQFYRRGDVELLLFCDSGRTLSDPLRRREYPGYLLEGVALDTNFLFGEYQESQTRERRIGVTGARLVVNGEVYRVTLKQDNDFRNAFIFRFGNTWVRQMRSYISADGDVNPWSKSLKQPVETARIEIPFADGTSDIYDLPVRIFRELDCG